MKVILFKSAQEDVTKPDKFQSALLCANLKASITPELIPVITFNYCNLDELAQKLEFHESYAGIIFSSPRCVSSVEKAISTSEIGNWENTSKRIFCVGRATAELAQKLFPNSQKILISQNENAESLGELIVQVFADKGHSFKGVTNSMPKLLYPCGNLKSDTLEVALSSGNVCVEVDNIIVYETVPNPELGLLISNLTLDQDSPFVFFSPSGVQNMVQYGKDLVCTGRPLIAIGATTRDAILGIDGVDGKDVYECESPSPAGVIKCLEEIISKSCTNS